VHVEVQPVDITDEALHRRDVAVAAAHIGDSRADLVHGSVQRLQLGNLHGGGS
jgi:hypothetical protein